jgi:anaplastic lymphoma kinase
MFSNLSNRIIAKGAGGGLGSGAVSSSRGAIVSSVIELHKDEEIYILVGQSGEHACIKSMGLQDESCAPPNAKQTQGQGPKVHLVKDIYIDNGAGGGGGGSFVFLVSCFKSIVSTFINEIPFSS